jgi:hypothetical protein
MVGRKANKICAAQKGSVTAGRMAKMPMHYRQFSKTPFETGEKAKFLAGRGL